MFLDEEDVWVFKHSRKLLYVESLDTANENEEKRIRRKHGNGK